MGILLDPVPSEKKVGSKKKKSELGLFGMGRCFVTRMFLRWGLSPSILASFLGLTRPSLGQQTGGGGWGFRKCDTARSYLKLPAARPFCSRLCRVGAAIVTHPPAPQEHSSPVHPHRDTWGGSPSISLVPGARAASGPGWETGMDPGCALASPHVFIYTPEKKN